MPLIKGSPESSSKSSALRSPGVVEGDSPGLPAHARRRQSMIVGLRRDRQFERQLLTCTVHARADHVCRQRNVPKANLCEIRRSGTCLRPKKRPPAPQEAQEEVDVAYERVGPGRCDLDAVAEDAQVALQVCQIRCIGLCLALLKLQRKVRPHVDVDRRRVDGPSAVEVEGELAVAEDAVQPLPSTVVVDAKHRLVRLVRSARRDRVDAHPQLDRPRLAPGEAQFLWPRPAESD
eukprot:scaffold24734_cov61-Phaeocystis_antarctica.AAC.8